MTHAEKLKRLEELGWTHKKVSLGGAGTYIDGWRWTGPTAEIDLLGPWSEPAPIPDELLALLDRYAVAGGEQPDGPKQAHTPEPWKLIWHGNEKYPYPLSIVTADGDRWIARDGFTSDPTYGPRMVQCVNACADIPDPAAHMAAQSERIAFLEALVEQNDTVHMEMNGEQNQRIAELENEVNELEKLWRKGNDIIAEQATKIERLIEATKNLANHIPAGCYLELETARTVALAAIDNAKK